MGARGRMESGALYLRQLRLEDGAVDELKAGAPDAPLVDGGGERLEANPSRQAQECCS